MRRGSDAVVGVDVGTTATKAGVYALDGAELSSGSVATSLRRGAAGDIEQDPAELLDSALRAIAAAVAAQRTAPAQVIALAVSGQMAGVLGIDVAGDPVTPYDSWLDTRCTPQLERLAQEHGDRVRRSTGCPPMIDHAPKLQWWRDERPEVYAQIARFVMPAGWIALRLAGLSAADAFIDPTYLHFSGAADAAAGTWSPPLVDALELDAARLPRIVACDRVIGALTPEMAQRCGLRAGTPIAAGLGDTAAGALGCGLARAGDLLDTAGTAAVLCGALSDFPPEPPDALIVMRGALSDGWIALNYVPGGGLCLPWLAAQMGADLTSVGIEALIAEADTVAVGADGLVFLPHLEGRIAPHQPKLRGGFVGLSLAHGRGHLARAVLEGVALEYGTYLRSMRAVEPARDDAVALAVGGGSRNAVWNAIKADVLGVPVRPVAVSDAATRGAALIAAAAVGAADPAQVAPQVVLGEPVMPDPERHERYGELAEVYRARLTALAEVGAGAGAVGVLAR